MHRVMTIAVALAALLVVQAPGWAQYAPPDKSTKQEKASMHDKKFVKRAAEDGTAEVELGRLASERASSDAVKQFAQRMVTDHQKANDELKSIAERGGLAVTAQADRKDQREQERLSKLSGEQFDRAYMKHMVRDHEKDLKAFQREAERGSDADVKDFAAKTVPTIQEHLAMARQLAGQTTQR